MLLNTIRAEWVKLRTTRSLYWTTALIVLFTLGWALLMGYANGSTFQQAVDDRDTSLLTALGDPSELFTVSTALQGLQLFGTMIVIVQAVITVTGEYGNGTAKLSALAAPGRWQLPVAKTVVYGAVTAVVFLVVGVASVFLTAMTANMQLDDKSLTDGLSLGADGAWRAVGLTVLSSVLVVMVSVGVGYLLRRTAGAVALLMLWVLLLEDLIGAIPKIGEHVTSYLPFRNLNAALSGTPIPDAPWGTTGSLIYFIVIVVVVFGAGIAVLRRRDV